MGKKKMLKIGSRPVAASAINYFPYEIFLSDLNPRDTIFGGRVLELCDKVAGVVAQRHSKKICVTLSMDSVRFLKPARKGETLIFKAAVNRAWKTSMEIGVKVLAENFRHGTQKHIASAYLTFVAVNNRFCPVRVPAIIPQTPDEKRRYKEAEIRRRSRLKA